MLNQMLSVLPLIESLPDCLPLPRFQIGQSVCWAHVPSHDFGRIVGVVYTSEASVRALGYHYAVQLDPSSPSYADGTRSDWAFEEDLALLPPDRRTAAYSNGQEESC